MWRSVTPFVPPRHLKRAGADSFIGQVAAELSRRGLPVPVRITQSSQSEIFDARFRHFVRERNRGGRAAPQAAWSAFEIEFAEPVNGPICLGYGSHYGLGRFETSPIL